MCVYCQYKVHGVLLAEADYGAIGYHIVSTVCMRKIVFIGVSGPVVVDHSVLYHLVHSIHSIITRIVSSEACSDCC